MWHVELMMICKGRGRRYSLNTYIYIAACNVLSYYHVSKALVEDKIVVR